MRRISMSLVALAVLGALLAPGDSQSAVPVSAGSACALVTTPLDTSAAGYYCSTAFSNYLNLRWRVVGDTERAVDLIDQDGDTYYHLSSLDGDPPEGSEPLPSWYCSFPCRVRLHLTPLTSASSRHRLAIADVGLQGGPRYSGL